MREKEFEDSSVSLIDDFLLNSRHGYAVSWVKNRISADGLDFNEKLQHEGMSSGFRGVVVDASHFDYYTDLIGNTFNNEKITINDINYPGGAYSWYLMYYRWISTFDFKADACPVTEWKTGKSHDFDVNFTDYADSKALKNKSVKDTSRTYSYTLKFARKTNASAPDPQTVADFNSPDYDVRTVYSENFDVRKTGKANVTISDEIYSLKPNEKIGIFIITEIKPSESNTVDLFSKNNETFTSGTLERTDDPIASINGKSDDKFKIKIEFGYDTQEDLEAAKKVNINYQFTSTSKFPDGFTSRIYNWSTGSTKNFTTIKINKGTSKVYPIALTVETDGDKSDSVYGYLVVSCSVKDPPGENPESITSQDPNEMAGPSGVGDDRLVLPGQWLDFKIHFENKAEASAAAQEIRIVNKLSPYLDWNSLELGDVAFNNQIVSALSGKNSGTVEVAAKDGSQNVRIQFKMDSATGELNWYLRSVDKSTADGWPLDPYAGFLPPNDANGSGEGYVAFRVKVRGDAPSGTKIDTSATITFDYNDPIETDPSWSNTVYAGKPLDFELTPVAEIVNGSVSLSWSASDFASSYDVFVWEEGSERPDEATVSGITGTSISFDSNLSVGKKYNFTVVARNAYGETSTSSITAEAKKVATYDIWSAENLTGLASAKRAKNVEVGGDGITNIEKYVFGLSAKKATVYGENGNFGIYVDSAGVSRVRFPERKYMTDAAVRVYYSTDMQNWTTDGVVISTVSDSDEDFLVKEAYFDGVQPENIWFKVEAYECE